MTIEEVKFWVDNVFDSYDDKLNKDEIEEAKRIVNTSLDAWEKIDDEIASLQDTYSIGNTYTEKLVWENLQAVRKTIHEYLKVVSKWKMNL